MINWHKALKDAVREDPDVILVGELRDIDTFEAAIHAAETGHLVFGTIHAASAGTTINRILDLFPPNKHTAIRQALANNLKAVVAQKLIKSIKPGVGRVPTNEVMIVNPTIKDLIIKGEDKKLPDAIRIGYLEGMVDFNENLRIARRARRHRQSDCPGSIAQPRPAENGAQGHQGLRSRYSVNNRPPRRTCAIAWPPKPVYVSRPLTVSGR